MIVKTQQKETGRRGGGEGEGEEGEGEGEGRKEVEMDTSVSTKREECSLVPVLQ